MGLRFVIGPVQSGKTTFIRREFLSLARAYGQKTSGEDSAERVLLIVPEQTNLTEQRALIAQAPGHTLLGADVLSFHRLAHHVLAFAGGPEEEMLDEAGKSMLLYRIVLSEAENLRYFGSSVRTAGFLSQLKSLFSEFSQYEVDPDQLEHALEHMETSSSLYARLSDLLLIARRYEAELEEQGEVSEKLLNRLSELIPETGYLKGSRILIDGFYDFPPQLLRVIAAMLREAAEVTIAISLPKAEAEEVFHTEPGLGRNACEKQDLYDSVRRSLYDLTELVRSLHIPVKIEYVSAPLEQLPENTRVIRHLAAEFFRIPPSPLGHPQKAVHLRKAAGVQEEVDAVFRQILTIVRSQLVNYRDIGIVAGDLTPYRLILHQAAQRYHIPIFLDEHAAASSQPLVRMILSLLQMVESRCSYDSFTAFLKTGFSPLTQDQIDRIENEALRSGTRSFRGFRDKIRMVVNSEENEEVVGAWLAYLENFFEDAGHKQEMTASAWCSLLEQFLNATGAEKMLVLQADALRSSGHEQQALMNRQLFARIAGVLTRIREIIGETLLDVQGFRGIFHAGIRELKLGMLPGRFDEVVVGDIERSRMKGLRILFLIGFSEDSFPTIHEGTGILSEHEREELSLDFRLAPGTNVQYYDQQFRLHVLLSGITEQLFVSYDASPEKGEERRPSLFWNRFELILGPSVYAGVPTDSLRLADSEFEAWIRGGCRDRELGEWFARHGFEDQIRQIRSMHRSQQESIGPQLSTQLNFEEHTEFSITMLETFAKCPMKYFLQYALGLKAREVFETTAADDGLVLHAVLKGASSLLEQLNGLSPQQIEEETARILGTQQEHFEIYQDNSRYRYFWRKLEKTASRALKTLKSQVENGSFRPEYYEWGFGSGKGKALPALEVSLASGRVIRMKGMIDRVDLLNTDDETWVRVLDYKSTAKKIDHQAIFDGVSLQLPVYLEAVSEGLRQKGKNVRPAGIFYFTLAPAAEEENVPLQAMNDSQKEEATLKASRLEGELNKDPKALEGMSSDPAMMQYIYKLRFTKNGKVHGADAKKLRTDAQLNGVGRFALRRIAEMAERMEQGDVSPIPYDDSTNRLPCTYCDYRAGCRFRPEDPSCQTRKSVKENKEHFWEMMEQE